MENKYETTMDGYIKETGNSVKYSQLSKEDAKALVIITMNRDGMDENAEFRKEVINSSPLIRIIENRIELLGKKITTSALAVSSMYTDRPGVSVLIAIDLVNHVGERDTINLDDVINCYPMGFYDIEDYNQMRVIIDMLKDRKVKNSEIY